MSLFDHKSIVLADDGTLTLGPPEKNPIQLISPAENNNSSILPLEQFRSGIPVQNVKCNQTFGLIIKAEDSSPACVRPDTAVSLVKNNWAFTGFSVIQFDKIYHVDRIIDFTIRYAGLIGPEPPCQHIRLMVVDSNQNTIWENKNFTNDKRCTANMYNDTFNFPYFIAVYTLSSLHGGPFVINKTGNYSAKIFLYGNTLEKEFIVS